MDEQQRTSSSKRNLLIGAGLLLVLLILVLGVYLFLGKNNRETGVRSFTSLFGQLGEETGQTKGGDIDLIGNSSSGNTRSDAEEEPLFRKLSTIPIAGATTITRDGKVLVRYIAKENGFTYEVDPRTGASIQLTNTTIPRIYEAYWANNGGTVIIRYLASDGLSQDVIKTYIAHLSLPKELATSTEVQLVLGTLIGEFLPDNISAVSISPDGKKLFYLIPSQTDVTGTTLDISTGAKREVLKNSFREWLPEILDDGTIILTTKPSAKVQGFAYLYNPKNQSFSRVVRKINGLTTLSNSTKSRLLYSENMLGKTRLNVYDQKGYAGDEGMVFHSALIPFATLPEKCVWAKNHVRIFCGAFTATPSASIPDEWYQGALSFSDIFWTANTDTSEIAFLADPTKEVTTNNQSFDVTRPFIGEDEEHFFFTNKTDMMLWSMRIIKERFMAGSAPEEDAQTESLTPDELKDAAGSAPGITAQ